jgi:hypothetical protein
MPRTAISPVDKIAFWQTLLSKPGFAGISLEALRRFDPTDDLMEINQVFLAPGGQLVSAAEITSIPPEGLVIQTPGTYRLVGQTDPATDANVLSWNPANQASAAITITCPNVVLDLGNCELRATVGDTSQSIAGIVVAPLPLSEALQNVTIRNGMLVNMCLYGISASWTNGLNIDNVVVSGLTYTNLSVRNACPAGIYVSDCANVVVNQCVVQYACVTADSSAGIQMLMCSTVQATECRVHNLVNYDGSGQGYSCMFCSNVTVSGCSAENIQTHFNGNIQAAGHTAIGYLPMFSGNLTYEGCSASKITGCSDDAHGMSLFQSWGVTVENFTATEITDGVTPSNTGAKATGLEVTSSLVTVSNSTVRKIRAIHPQDRQSAGFSTCGAAVTFENCTAEDVVVCNGRGESDPGLGNGTGFGWAPDPRAIFRNGLSLDVQYVSCTARRCQVGFDTWNHVNSTWTNPSFDQCGTNILVQTTPPNNTRALAGNPESECNPPIVVTVTNQATGNIYPPH